MLEGLDAVDWRAVRQAFGDGAHLPGALRRLTSADAQERSAGYWKLDNYVVVQGNLAPAAVVVVPFLLEIAAGSASPDTSHGAEEALDLLYEIGTGYSDDPALVEAARAAVAQGAEVYWRALEQGATPGSRSTAAFLLASLGQPELAPRLLVAARAQTDEELVATAVLRAAEAAECGLPAPPAFVAELERFAREASGDDFLAAAGAAALAMVARAATPEWAVERLLESMTTAWPPAQPGAGHSARGEAGRPVYALRAVGLSALLRALVLVEGEREARHLLEVALEVACPGLRVRHCWDRYDKDSPRLLVRHYEKLDAAASAWVPHDLVRAALAAAPLWTVQSDLLDCYGLPTTREALAAWLAVQS
ncbi:MAG: hypothetical protein IT370_17210 [Deltaproteobacteria bacterium]|nr:hypothetical protein [Deltaproteobacteria bacterium]